MRSRFILPLWLLVCSQVFSQDLLKVRDWKSGDGATLSAELVSWDGEVAKLKRARDGKVFDLASSRLSGTDTKLLEDASKMIESMAKDAVKVDYSRSHFVGFSDPSEETWTLAQRLSKHDLLWRCVTQQVWEARGSDYRVISLSPMRFIGENPSSSLIIGKFVAIRVLAPEGANLTAGANGLALVRSGNAILGKNTKTEIAKKGIAFSPRCMKEDLLSCKMEEIGVSKYLVFTVKIRDSKY